MKIGFSHNVHDRPKTLAKTISVERTLFPDANICVAYNTLAFEKDFKLFDNLNVDFIYFEQQQHKIGCTNGAYHSITSLFKYEPDVIVFSHDDVMITNVPSFRKNLENIFLKKNDFIGRTPNNAPDIGQKYIMMEAMFFSNKGAKTIYKNFKPFIDENNIEKDLRGSISPEVNMYNLVERTSLEINVYQFMYHHYSDPKKYNESLNNDMGYTHLNIGIRGWKE